MAQIRIPKDIIPANETHRLEKLKHYEILDTPAENSFDAIALLAAEIFNVPNAAITFLAGDRVFFKSDIGNLKRSNSRKDNLCALAILNEGVTLIEDTFINNNQLINYNNNTRFYAAAPLLTEEGYALGTLQVSDFVPRHPTKQQLNMLKLLAGMVMDKLEYRIAARKNLQAHDDRLHLLVHDLKNPMTTISLQAELMSRIPGSDEKISTIAGKINRQSKNIIDKLNDMLSSAKSINASFKPRKELLHIPEVFNEIESVMKLSAEKKSQTIHIDIKEPVGIYADRAKFKEIFKQLISNAIKFSAHENEVKISMLTNENTVTIAVADNGVGLSTYDLEHVFTKFAVLSSHATQNENANGLGLSLVKMLVDLHKGKVWAESEGKDKGTTFFVELPVK